METVRKDILPYVALTCIKTDKFKTNCLSINLLTQLRREDAAWNAIIPYVLRRGTTYHPDMESLSAALDDLYGAAIDPIVRKKGEIQSIGFYADFIDDAYVPGNAAILEQVTALLGEFLLSPNTRGGLFLPAYVEGEKAKLLEKIRGRVNDKRSYSLYRLNELMCQFEDYAVGALGNEAEAEGIGYQKLTKHYRSILASSPIEIFYCGSAEFSRVESALVSAFAGLPRGDFDLELGTDIRMNALEETVRYYTDELDVTQGKLAVGFRLGSCMEEPDTAAIRVFNAVYGGSLTSKLFTNVRERLSLCYFASSGVDLHKGILRVSSGIEFDKFDAALAEILSQLDAIKRGEITEEELDSSRKYVAGGLRTITDSTAHLEDFSLSSTLQGLDCTPQELAALAESVTKEEVVAIANGVECDTVYFMKGLPEAEEEAENEN
ncbi:MAG: EF-P 5-aminopentanol modification-associated protein YfmF [Oscillospiraceae bacterium]